MDLPKNVTQIGETDAKCKIYVEDYVVSYLKQLNAIAENKELTVALYGVRKEENEIEYLFLYGACKVNFLQKETRHLSQAQQQEIEKNRKKYFKEYSFLAYRPLKGEMIEGFYVCDKGVSRYIEGYLQFYEKNESMLAYMLEVRKETEPETVDRVKYEEVKKRQEERRASHQELSTIRTGGPKAAGKKRGMSAAVLVVLCAAGLAATNGNLTWKEIRDGSLQMLDKLLEWQQADAVEVGSIGNQVDTLVAEDRLADAILQENESGVLENELQSNENASIHSDFTQPVTVDETDESQNFQENMSDDSVQPQKQEQTGETQIRYTILPGDTLTAICIHNYGSDEKISEICELNRISDPDDIKVGEKIVLP